MSLVQVSDNEYFGTAPDRSAYHFSTTRPDDIIDGSYGIWPTALQEVQPIVVPGTEILIIPNGPDNRLPQVIRDVVAKAHLPGGIFKKMLFLNWGQGPKLYVEDYSSGKPERKWVQDPEIDAWLQSWDFERYLMAAMVDFNHGEGCYSKLICNRGMRIGRAAKIVKLEHISWGDGRLEWPQDLQNSRAVIVANWQMPHIMPVYRYPMFDRANPFRTEITGHFAYLPSYMSRFYSVPSFTGSLPWMKNSSLLPKAIKSLMHNAAIVKFHVKVPQEYWDKMDAKLKEECSKNGKTYTDKLFRERKAEVMNELVSVLSGYDNVGKFFTSTYYRNRAGELEGWEIIPIDQKVENYISGMKDVNTMADKATIGGIGLHQALANVSAEGKSDSGSEQLYALKLYKDSQIAIPELIVCEAINMAIKANWPSKKVKLGFYQAQVEREQDVTTKNRITQNV